MTEPPVSDTLMDLMTPQSEHPHGFEDEVFEELFTADKPVIFAFDGSPALIHRLTYRRHNHDNVNVRATDEGTTTTLLEHDGAPQRERFGGGPRHRAGSGLTRVARVLALRRRFQRRCAAAQ